METRGYDSKGLKDYVSRGMAALAIAGLSFSGVGCQTLFRNNEIKNQAPVADAISIDYSSLESRIDRIMENNRAYQRDNHVPPKILEEVIEVPEMTRYKVSAINATYILDSKDNIIMQYKSRIPAPDLMKLVAPRLDGIEVSEFPNQNTLIMYGTKEAFGDFKNVSTLLNEFDLPPEQIRVNLRIVEYFNDNTYDRDLSLKFLRKGLEAITLNLPSSPDPTSLLTTGISINPFFTRSDDHDNMFEGAIKFLDSHGKTNTLADVDILVSNGKPANFSNLSSEPYTEVVTSVAGFKDSLVYRDIGVDISLIPYANEEGFITVKLEKAKSGEKTGFEGTIQRPTFREANLTSDFTVRDGITYFVGTSLFTRYKSVDRGLPGLNKIPGVKNFATSRSIENNQSQLLYFITARVIPRDSKVGMQEE